MRRDVLPVILGANEGAYALSQAFYYGYGIVPLVLDDTDSPLFAATLCAYFRVQKNIRKKDILYRILEDFYEKNQGKSLILIPADAQLLSFVREREERLSLMYLLPHLPTPSEDSIPKDARALAVLYRTGKGECRTVYADILARTPKGEVAAALAKNIPAATEAALKSAADALSRGVYLFYEDEKGRLYRDGETLPRLSALSAAKDASIPEWMLEEMVLSVPLSETQSELSGLFTLFPYRKVRRYLSKHDRKRVRSVQKCALYTYRTEGFRRDIARVFKALWHVHTNGSH